jgi:hypothetical protein
MSPIVGILLLAVILLRRAYTVFGALASGEDSPVSALNAMSPFGPKQTKCGALQMSAFGGKADIAFCGANVR